MPDNTSLPSEILGDSRESGKQRWRGKIWSTEGKFGRKAESKESTNEDIAHFLQAGGTRVAGASQTAAVAPRIDVVAARKPLPLLQASPFEIVDVYRRPKPRQNKGLRVRFEKAAPQIIGEGGDEAELPAKEVSRSYTDHIHNVQAQVEKRPAGSSKERSPEPLRRSPNSENEVAFQPPLLQRWPTGYEDLPIRTENEHRDEEEDREASVYSVSRDDRHKPLPQPPLNQGKVEGEYISNDYAKSMGTDLSAKIPGSGDHIGAVSPLDAPTSEIFANNSVTPRASPQPPINNHGSLMSKPVSRQDSSAPSYGLPPAGHEVQKSPEFSKSEHQIRHQSPKHRSTEPESRAWSLQKVAKGIGDDSFEEFGSRVRRFNDIFLLGIPAHGDLSKITFVQWVRTAAWWFVKGRSGLESTVRSKSVGAQGSHVESVLNQAWLDLAKALWITEDIAPNHPGIRRYGVAGMSSTLAVIKNFGEHELVELVEALLSVVANMRALAMSMKRNGMLPPHALRIESLNPRVLLELPCWPSAFANLLINNTPAALTKGRIDGLQSFFPIPVGDTGRFFCFGRMFAKASLDCDEEAVRNMQISCVLSVVRERTDWGVKAAIASQDGQINLIIQASPVGGATWRDVNWRIPLHAIQIRLSNGLGLNLSFSDKDFKTLWGIYDYTRQVQKNLSSRKDEEIIFERDLKDFHCTGSADFPSDPVPGCALRLFEKKNCTSGANAQIKIHDGYRLTVVTPPERKTLSSVNYGFGKGELVLFSYVQSKNGHSLSFRLPSNVTLIANFHEASDYEFFRTLLCGTFISKQDIVYGSLQLQSLSIMGISVDRSSRPGCNHDSMQAFHKLRIVKKSPPSGDETASARIGSEYLRMIAESDTGTLTDCLSLGSGELHIKLSVENSNELVLLRPPQQDMTWSILYSQASEEELDSLGKILHIMVTSTTARTYHFRSISTLHNFQTILSGFQVLFDGPATNFAISRKRMVAMHKRWEATSIRLQVLKNDRVIQLVAFFKDFSHGTCMSFVLKVTDVFEAFSKSGMFYLCLADAKFALPKGEEDQTKDFVCLETPEYPSEHDDITIGFDNEQDRDRFSETLPAPANIMSKMASLRK